MEIPPQLRAIKPYLTHAKQLGRFDPLMAYYCRCYAVQLGVQAHRAQATDASKAVLMGLLDSLEQDKRELGPRLDEEANKAPYVTQFALKIFGQADDEDRAGKATRTTARSFYAASIFLNILRQFSPDDALDAPLEEKLRYAKWKAADINTAIKQGRTPQPGPPPEGMADQQEDEAGMMPAPATAAPGMPAGTAAPGMPAGTAASLPAPTQPSLPSQPVLPPAPTPPPAQPSHPTVPTHAQPPAPAPSPAPAPAPTASQPASRPFQPTYRPTDYDNMGVADNNIELAMRHSKYAVSALQFEDVAAAVANLQKALAFLQH